MIISERGHQNIDVTVKLKRLVSFGNYRGIRKLLEITSEGTHLLSDANGIYGVGKINAIPYDKNTESLFIVEFTSHHSWTLQHATHQLMTVNYGQPKLPAKAIHEGAFQTKIRNKIPQIDVQYLTSLWNLADKASKQKHGTMIVVSDHAREEAERLENQSTPIEPILLTADLILPLSSIDGALLIEPNTMCHAIGVILDGIATEKGNPARGARYNSAIRYIDYVSQLNHLCLIIVISEDGMIDLF